LIIKILSVLSVNLRKEEKPILGIPIIYLMKLHNNTDVSIGVKVMEECSLVIVTMIS